MDIIFQIDAKILLWIQNNVRNELLSPIVKFVTHLGDHGILWIVLLFVLICIPKTRKAGLLGAGALILTFIVTNLCLKPMIARTRPYELIEGLTRIIERQSDRSFPSGHTANSMAVGVMLWLVSQKEQELESKGVYFPKAAGWFVLVLSVLIGLSRLYVGVHYPTDVIGGAVIAVLDVFLVYRFYKYFMKCLDIKK